MYVCDCRVNVDLPTALIEFKDVNVSSQVSVGSRALPTLPNSVLNFGEVSFFLTHLSSNAYGPVFLQIYICIICLNASSTVKGLSEPKCTILGVFRMC